MLALMLAVSIGIHIEIAPPKRDQPFCSRYNFVRFITKKESRVVVYCGRPYIAGRHESLEMTASCGMFRRRVTYFIVDGERRPINAAVPTDQWGAIEVDLDTP